MPAIYGRRASDKLKVRLCDLAFHSDMKAIRLMLAFGAIFIGLGFLWPVPLFPTAEQLLSGTGRHTYTIMAQIAPQNIWGLAFLAQGSLMLWSLVNCVQNRVLLWADAAFGSVLWSVAVGSCYLAYWNGFEHLLDYRPPAIMGGEVAAAIASWWTFVRYTCGESKRD